MAERQTQLDGLRGVAAVVVVLVHGIVTFDYALFTGAPRDSLVGWDVKISGAPFLLPLAGDLAVCLFFALSGFVLSQSFTHTRLGTIALLFKRYTRLVLPILTVCLLAYSLLAGGTMKNVPLAQISRSTWLASQMRQAPSFEQALREGLYRALVHLKPNWITYDSALWTMNIEFWGSVMLIAVFGLTALPGIRAGSRETLRLWLLAALGLLGASSYLGLFAVGALLNLTQVDRRVSSPAAALFLGAGVFLGTIPVGIAPLAIVRPFGAWRLPTNPIVPFPETSVVFCHAIGAILILVAANSFLPFRRMLVSPVCQFLGHISFPLYLIHMPMLLSIVCSDALTMLSRGLPYLGTAVLSLALLLAVSIGAATALLYICERPSIVLSGRVGVWTDRIVRGISGRIFPRAHPG